MRRGMQRQLRRVGRRPSRLRVLVAMLLQVLPSPLQHRSRVRNRLDHLQAVWKPDPLREKAP